MEKEENYSQYASQTGAGLKDVEEKQRVLKERVLLIGQNLIETREENSKKITELKKEMTEMKQDVRSMKRFIERISEEFSKFARRDDLNILAKKVKMFEPLKNLEKQ